MSDKPHASPTPPPQPTPAAPKPGTQEHVDATLCKPILYWHRQLETKRDLLCLAVVMRSWNFIQEENTTLEDEVTKNDYLAAIEAAKQLIADTKKKEPRAVVMAHPSSLIAVMVKKPSRSEAEFLMKVLSDLTVDAEQTKQQVNGFFVNSLVWPAQASEAMAYLIEECPMAVESVFPDMMYEIAGADRSRAKKRG